MIKIFRGGRGGGCGGGSSKRCLKWGGGGLLRNLSKNILKQVAGKAKVVCRGEGVLKVSPPLPRENFNHTPCMLHNFQFFEFLFFSFGTEHF